MILEVISMKIKASQSNMSNIRTIAEFLKHDIKNTFFSTRFIANNISLIHKLTEILILTYLSKSFFDIFFDQWKNIFNNLDFMEKTFSLYYCIYLHIQ